MKYIINWSFIVIWFIAAISFGWIALESYKSMSTSLPRYEIKLQELNPMVGMRLGNVEFKDVVSTVIGVADSHNENIEILEESIRSSAKTAFSINILSFIAASFGFVSQLFQYLHDKRENKNNKSKCPPDDRDNLVDVPKKEE